VLGEVIRKNQESLKNIKFKNLDDFYKVFTFLHNDDVDLIKSWDASESNFNLKELTKT
jgi:hypothetical protein